MTNFDTSANLDGAIIARCWVSDFYITEIGNGAEGRISDPIDVSKVQVVLICATREVFNHTGSAVDDDWAFELNGANGSRFAAQF